MGWGMSSLRGNFVVAWLERGGDRFLRESQPSIYQALLLHVGGTDVLRRYHAKPAYWQHVQAVLDCFFTASERAELCRGLIQDALFPNDPGYSWFLDQARAEIRCRELVALVERIESSHKALNKMG